MTTPTFQNEREFTREVIRLAEEYHWETFRIQDRAYQTGGVPAGFPDLLLRYRDEQGNFTMVAAELKTDNDETSQPTIEQTRFLEELATRMPTYVFRYRDWDYIEDMLRNGPPEATGKIILPSLPINRDSTLLPPQPVGISTIIQRIANEFASPDFPRGDLAELRRMNPDNPATPAFWRIMAQHNLPDTAWGVSRWALILHGIALMTPTANAKIPVGRALFLGGSLQRDSGFYSEVRLERLLKSQGAIFRNLINRLFKMLASAKQPLDWEEMAALIIDDSDAARYKIASDYYRAAPRTTQRSET